MKNNHIPGPWEFDEDTGAIDKVGDGASIGRAFTPDDFPCLDEEENDTEEVANQCRANGLLMAAAPQLLAALQIYVDTYGWTPSARTAIERTTGTAGLVESPAVTQEARP